MKFFYFLLIAGCVEVILGYFYYMITPVSIRLPDRLDYKSLSKGIIERVFLMVSLLNGYPHALTLFGTLKLATRLKRDTDADKTKESTYNDFYLLGNFISILISFLYVFLYEKIVLLK